MNYEPDLWNASSNGSLSPLLPDNSLEAGASDPSPSSSGWGWLGVGLGVCGLEETGLGLGGCVVSQGLQPLLCGLGLLLNLVSMAIFATALARGQRTTMVVYLFALCIFDSVQLALSLLILYVGDIRLYYSPEQIGVGHVSWATYDLLCEVNAYATRFFYPLLMAANYGSIWVVTLICVQRYFAICHPLSSLRTVELGKAWLEVSALAAAALALNAVRFFEFSLDSREERNQTLHFIQPGPLHPQLNPLYMLIYECVVYVSLIYVVPFGIVAILNARILMVICRARTLLPRMSRNHRREHRSAFMILAIILLFVLCYTPAVAERLWSTLDRRSSFSQFGRFTNLLSNFLVNANSALDPLMYALFSRGFKDLFHRIRNKSATSRSFLASETSAALRSGNLARKKLNGSSEASWEEDGAGARLNQTRHTSIRRGGSRMSLLARKRSLLRVPSVRGPSHRDRISSYESSLDRKSLLPRLGLLQRVSLSSASLQRSLAPSPSPFTPPPIPELGLPSSPLTLPDRTSTIDSVTDRQHKTAMPFSSEDIALMHRGPGSPGELGAVREREPQTFESLLLDSHTD